MAKKEDRTGTRHDFTFGMQRKYDLREGFPILNNKKSKFDGVLREPLGFYEAQQTSMMT